MSGFITNQLFGRNHGKWCGKQFGLKEKEEQVGINRFFSKTQSGKVETEHLFDYSISPSRFGGKSLVLKYENHQGMLSPWKSMVDEVRVLRPLSDDGDIVVIGMGSMAWSGSYFNSQPFCLIKRKL